MLWWLPLLALALDGSPGLGPSAQPPSYPFRRLWQRRDLSPAGWIWTAEQTLAAVDQRKREIVALEPLTGRDRWRVKLPGRSRSEDFMIQLLGPRVLARAEDGTLSSYRSSDGRLEWTMNHRCLPMYVQASGATGLTTCVNTRSSRGSLEGKAQVMIAFDLPSGAELWRLPGARPIGHDWMGEPMSVGERLVVAAFNSARAFASTVKAFDARSGRQMWVAELAQPVWHVTVTTGVVLIGGREIHALDPESGRSMWKAGPDEGESARQLQLVSPAHDPAMFEGLLVKVVGNGIAGLDPRTGQTARSWVFPHSNTFRLEPRAWTIGRRLLVLFGVSWTPVTLGIGIVDASGARVFLPPTPKSRVLGSVDDVLVVVEDKRRAPLQGWSTTE